MTTALEREIHARLTTEFINENPVTATFQRRVRTPDGAGGFITSYQDVAAGPQTFRFVDDVGVQTVRTDLEGSERTIDMKLIGAADLDIALWDRIPWEGYWWLVVHINPNDEWRTRAEVMRDGALA